MDRLERLLNLLAALIDTERPLGREEIHQRVPGYPERDDSFRRQFERDKETLRQMGVPIAVEPLIAHSPEQGTGYRVHQRDYALADPGLTPEELTALHLAASSVRFLGDDAKGAISKLGGVPVGEVDGANPAGVEVPGVEHLEACFAAIAGNFTLTFGYKGERRTVVPARLSFRSGRWYLSTWDVNRDAERLFRLDRMDDPEVGDAAPDAPRARVAGREPLAAWELGDDEPVPARLRVDPDQADLAVRAVGGRGKIDKEPDGGVVIELAVRNPEGFRNFVLGFLDHAEVLEPESLRSDMVQWLERMASA
ncbi:MAG TPA: WYL domain-containing protein [Acidimicrobiales bacterium]|nr:WYL domain-containing protein [Acidimicrobiales bacterium]